MTNLSDWQGKKPNPAWKPLNDTWFTTASMARHLPDGSTLHTLTEGPEHGSGALFRVLSWLAFIGAACAVASYPLWRP